MITQFSIKNSVLTISLIVISMLAGISVFTDLPRDDMPPFLIRAVNVITLYPGASPERVENLVSDKIEEVVQEIPEVDYITSESRTGISIVTVFIKESEFDLRPIFDRIRRKVEDIEASLPTGTVVRIDDEVGDVFGIILGLTAEGYSYAELKDIADEVRDDLIRLPNSAKIEISGDREERVYIEFNEARLAETGVTQKQLQEIISGTNIVGSGGDIEVGSRRIILEPSGNFESIQALQQLIITQSGKDIVYLGDVATIRRGYVTPKESLIKINGKPGLAIAVNLIKGGNLIKLGTALDLRLKYYQEIYPYGVEIERVASQDIVVAASVSSFMSNLVQAVIVVLLVMLLFLGLRTGLVVASLIPATIVISILLMSIFDIGLNKVTLAALIVALGLLVDNAIVMSESVMVKMADGLKVLDAAIEAARELMIPLLTSSLTTSAAFMAFFLAESVMGEMMGNIFVVLTMALLTSWLLSLTMITLLCVYVIKVEPKQEGESSGFDKINGYYRQVLLISLKRPVLVISCVLLLFSASMYFMRFVPVIFMPDSDRPLVTINIELPLGTVIDETERVASNIDQYIAEKLLIKDEESEGVINWSSYVGVGAPKYDLGYTAPESSPHAAHVLVNTTSDGANDAVIEQLDDYIFNHFPDATYTVSRLASGGGSANPIEVRISGGDSDQLYKISEQVKSQLSSITGTRNISDDWGLRTQKFVVNINPSKAQIAGVSNQDIATSLQTVLSGKQVGDFREGDQVIPIVMQNNLSAVINIEDLDGLSVYSQQSGKRVPLKQVADIQLVWQASKILRRDLTKTITVKSDLEPGYTAAQISATLNPWLEISQSNWGLGYGYELGGDAEGSSDAMSAVMAKLPLSLFIIILLLIAQFNSIRKPFIILATIPLGMIGVVLGLLLTGSYFGFLTFLGIISLAGIVINNGIVLLDRIKMEEEENNRTAQDAIVEAGVARLRPILLTTATTSLGLIPLWLGGGLMWEPMAISIIFGLLFATILTLLFVPVLYRVLFRIPFV